MKFATGMRNSFRADYSPYILTPDTSLLQLTPAMISFLSLGIVPAVKDYGIISTNYTVCYSRDNFYFDLVEFTQLGLAVN